MVSHNFLCEDSYVRSICACLVLSVSSSALCLGRAAACDCGTPWTFRLPFFFGKHIHICLLSIFFLDSACLF